MKERQTESEKRQRDAAMRDRRKERLTDRVTAEAKSKKRQTDATMRDR